MEKYNFIGIKETIKDIKEQAQTINDCIEKTNMDINNAIGKDGNAWKGRTASEFLSKWQEYTSEMKELTKIINKQTENLEFINQIMSEE